MPPRSLEAVLDTSVWIAVFNDEPVAGRLPETQGGRTAVFTPIVLAELAAKHRLGSVRASRPVATVEQVARSEPLTRGDALVGGDLFGRLRRKGRTKASLGDCLVYATARRIGAPLITCDSDLEALPGVLVLGASSRRRGRA